MRRLSLLCVLLVVLAACGTSHPKPPRTGITASNPVAIAWLGQMEFYDVHRNLDNPQLYLNQLASDHFGGFLLDNRYGTVDDDFQNGGAGRMSSADYATAQSQVTNLVTQAKAQNVGSVFLRLNANVSCRPCVGVTGSSSKWDIFNTDEVAQFVQSWTNQASFAQATGMTGIWLDGEPYGENLWDETQDPTLQASTLPTAQVRAQYFSLGQQATSAVMAVNPSLRLLVDPLVNNNTGINSEIYTYFPDFIAGMISVLSTKTGAYPLTIAPENSFASTSQSSPTYARTYSNVMGSTYTALVNGVPKYYGIKEGLQYWDAQNGTGLWNWHLAHDTVMLATEPFSFHAATNAAMWGTPTDLASTGSNSVWLPTYQQNLQAIRNVESQNNAPYFWVYDNANAFMGSSYNCQFPVGTVFTSSTPCPGIVQGATLP